MATVWQLIWYRNGQRTARLSRVELVEHDGFVTLLAERAGVRVPRVIIAGSAGSGDALVVVRDGFLLTDGTAPNSAVDVTDAGLSALWSDVRRLHEVRIIHGQLDLDRVLCRVDGTLGFADLSSASVGVVLQPLARGAAVSVTLARTPAPAV